MPRRTPEPELGEVEQKLVEAKGTPLSESDAALAGRASLISRLKCRNARLAPLIQGLHRGGNSARHIGDVRRVTVIFCCPRPAICSRCQPSSLVLPRAKGVSLSFIVVVPPLCV